MLYLTKGSTGYNRSVDLWSTGVITYVSLSGQFPFNEESISCFFNLLSSYLLHLNLLYNIKTETKKLNEQECSIPDQIRDARFMFPEKVWGSISSSAVSCIKKLLTVKIKYRYNVDQGLRDPWLMDKQCLEDIRSLEEKARELNDFE